MENLSKKIGENLDFIDEDGRTQAHLAALNGDTEALKVCKRVELYMEAEDNFSNTPASLATRNGHTKALRCLEELGVDIKEDRNKEGQTLAHVAALRGYTGTFIYLVEEVKVDVEAKDKDGDKLIHLVVLIRDIGMLNCLEKAKADLNAIDGDGMTPIQLAILYRNTKMATYLLLSKVDLNIINKKGETALDIAYKCFYFNLLKVGKVGLKKEQLKKIIDSLIKAGAKTGKELREERKQEVDFERAGKVCDRGNKEHKED